MMILTHTAPAVNIGSPSLGFDLPLGPDAYMAEATLDTPSGDSRPDDATLDAMAEAAEDLDRVSSGFAWL